MAKETALSNEFDGAAAQSDKYDRKYFKYLDGIKDGSGDIIAAFRTKNIGQIESALKSLAVSMNSHIFLIGMGCVIIEREGLYAGAGYGSYLEYAKHLYEETGLSPQSISAAKIIMERFIEYYSELKKYGFRLEHNSNKLLYIETALANHKNAADVFRRLCGCTFREFVEYSRGSDEKIAQPRMPVIKMKDGKITVDGKEYGGLPEMIKKTVEQDFANIYSIRAAGNAPLIIETYDEREARALKSRVEKLLKDLRSGR